MGCCGSYPEEVCRQHVKVAPASLPPSIPSLQMGWVQTQQLPERPVLQPGNVRFGGPRSNSLYYTLPSKSTIAWAWVSLAPDLEIFQDSWLSAPYPRAEPRKPKEPEAGSKGTTPTPPLKPPPQCPWQIFTGLLILSLSTFPWRQPCPWSVSRKPEFRQ